MALPESAPAYWLQQQRVAAVTMALTKRLWRRMGTNFDASWQEILPQIVAAVERAQAATAAAAVDFVPAALADQNLDVDQLAEVSTERLVGVTGGGVPIAEAFYSSVVRAKTTVGQERPVAEALNVGGQWLQMLVQSTLSDTSRAAELVSITARDDVGYTRMLSPPSCSRCVILAGRFYRYNAGFRRHPRCDCKHFPTRENVAGDVRVDGQRYFDSLSPEEQDRTFTKAGAEAVRAGADLAQVVNADRGMQVAQVYGRRLAITTEGTTKRGVAGQVIRARGRTPVTTPRLMPEAIMEIAEDRADALRLLRLNGYVLNRDGVPLSGRGSRRGLVPDSVVTKNDTTAVAASPSANVATAGISVAPEPTQIAGYAEAVTAQIDDRIGFMERMQFENDFLSVPLHVRQLLHERGVQVVASRRVSEGPFAAMFDGITAADGRAIDEISFYQNQIRAVVISTDAPHGSVNVVAHEIGHALDSNALRDNPVDVVWQEQGNPNLPPSIVAKAQEPRTHSVRRFIEDPYIEWAHKEYVLNSPTTNDYWRTGSEGTPKSGREEWLAEGYASLIAGNDAQLLAISGGSREAADILTWTYRRMGMLP